MTPKMKPVMPFPFRGARCFVEHARSCRLSVRYFQRAQDGGLLARALFGPGAEGAPGQAHGGSISATLDEALGAAAWWKGYAVITLRLTVRYRRPVPLGTEAVIEPEVYRADQRRVFVRGALTGTDGRAYAEAEGVFMRLPPAEVKRLLQPRQLRL